MRIKLSKFCLYAFSAILISLLMGSMIVGFNSPVGTLFLHRIVMILSLFIVFLYPKTFRIILSNNYLLIVLMTILIIYVFLGFLVSQQTDFKNAFRWLELFCLFALGIICRFYAGEKAIHFAFRICLVILCINLIDYFSPGLLTDLISSINLPRTQEQITWLHSIEIRGDVRRLQGTLYHSLSLGAFSATFAAFTLEMMRKNIVPIKSGIFAIILSALISLLTISRSSLLTIAVLCFVYVNIDIIKNIHKKGRTKFYFVLFLYIAILLFFFIICNDKLDMFLNIAISFLFPTGVGSDTSLDIRYSEFITGINLFYHSPIFGNGIMYLRNQGIILDNFFLSTLVEGGILGGIILVLMLLSLVRFKPFQLWPMFLVGALQILAFDFWGFWDSGGVYWLLCGLLCTTETIKLKQDNLNHLDHN